MTFKKEAALLRGVAVLGDAAEQWFGDSGDSLAAIGTTAVFDGEPVVHWSFPIRISWTDGGEEFTDDLSCPASEDWEPKVYDAVLADSGWQRCSDWRNYQECSIERIA